MSHAAKPKRHTVSPMNRTRDMPRTSSMKALACRCLDMAAFEIGGAHLRVGHQGLAGARQHDAAVDHDIAAVGQLERVVGVLLDQEDGDPLALVDVADHL